MRKLNYTLASTPQEVNNFVNDKNREVVSITYDGRDYVVFYYMEY